MQQTHSANKRYERFMLLLAALCIAWLAAYQIGLVTDQNSILIPAAKRSSLPQMAASTLQGAAWQTDDLKGHVALINFWATWCPPCREELPGLIHLSRRFKAEGVKIIGIEAGGENAGQVRSFAAKEHIPYPILLADTGRPDPLDRGILPTTLLIDRNGKVAKTWQGAVSETTFRSALQQALKER